MENTILDTLKMSSEPLKSADIAKQTGLDKNVVDKALKTLKEQGLIDSPKRCFYAAK